MGSGVRWTDPAKSYRRSSQTARMSKYTLAYAIMALFIGLGAYIVCRPSRRYEGDR